MYETGMMFPRGFDVLGARTCDFGTYALDRGSFLPHSTYGLFGIGGWLVALFWALVLVGFVVAVFVAAAHRKRAVALEPLKMRFVNGEITEDEYLAKKAALFKR